MNSHEMFHAEIDKELQALNEALDIIRTAGANLGEREYIKLACLQLSGGALLMLSDDVGQGIQRVQRMAYDEFVKAGFKFEEIILIPYAERIAAAFPIKR